MDHPIFIVVLATILFVLGLHLLLANKFWTNRYLDILGGWDIQPSPRFTLGMVLFSGFIVALSGIALGTKALMELLRVY